MYKATRFSTCLHKSLRRVPIGTGMSSQVCRILSVRNKDFTILVGPEVLKVNENADHDVTLPTAVKVISSSYS